MRFAGLDLLRAIAILWVLFFHGLVLGIGTPFPFIARSGWMAVDLFFVLSGYLIALQLFSSFDRAEPGAVRKFYLRRAFRILPAYGVVVALYAWLPAWRESPGMQPAWQFLTFTQNFLIDYQHNIAFSHAWSLCVEEHFYLLFPWLAWGALRLGSARLVAGFIAAIALGGVALRLWLWRHTLDGGAVLASEPWRFVETVYYPTTVRCDGLLVGVTLAAIRVFRPAWWQRAAAHPARVGALGAAVLALAIAVALPRTTEAAVVFGYPLLAVGFGLLLVTAASPGSVLSRVAIPGARWLATITFSTYLTHKMTWAVLRDHFPALVPPGTAQAFFVYGGSALLVGGLLYLAVEKPFLLLRQRLERSAPPSAGMNQVGIGS